MYNVILATNYLKNVPSIDIALISTLFVTEQRGCLSYNRYNISLFYLLII
jgi:hypothetical protein